MGMTTPFPEPDSPELQRFVVHSPDEIAGLLGALQRCAVPLNVFIDPGSAFDVAAPLDVDGERGELLFEWIGNRGLREQVLGASRVTFVGFVDAAKLQFSACGVRPAVRAGRSAFSVRMPTQILRLQRRSATRVQPGIAGAAVCYVALPNGGVARQALRVLDIGAGGLALLGDSGSFLPTVGSSLKDCRLDLPGVGRIQVDLRVRHVDLFQDTEQAGSCGCAFEGLTASAQEMLNSYLRQLAKDGAPYDHVRFNQTWVASQNAPLAGADRVRSWA